MAKWVQVGGRQCTETLRPFALSKWNVFVLCESTCANSDWNNRIIKCVVCQDLMIFCKFSSCCYSLVFSSNLCPRKACQILHKLSVRLLIPVQIYQYCTGSQHCLYTLSQRWSLTRHEFSLLLLISLTIRTGVYGFPSSSSSSPSPCNRFTCRVRTWP